MMSLFKKINLDKLLPIAFFGTLGVLLCVGLAQNLINFGTLGKPSDCLNNNTCSMPDGCDAIGAQDYTPCNKPICNLTQTGIIANINMAREGLHEAAVTELSQLDTSAAQKLQDMVSKSYYGHTSLDGSMSGDFGQLIAAQGLHGVKAGEDLDANAYTDSQVWQNFKDSPSHFASVTDSAYAHVGVSVACNVHYTNVKDTSPESEPQLNGNTTGMDITSLVVVHLAQ